MFSELRRGILAGLGAVLLTRDRIEEVTRRMVDDAKLSREDARKLTDELAETGERQWKEMEDAVNESVKKRLDSLGIGSKTELKELKAKVENLEKRVSILESLERSKGV